MIEVDEALSLVLDRARPRPARRVPLAEALGLTLAEDVASDIDSPPYDKAMVDGYALRWSDIAAGRRELVVLEEVTAGLVPSKKVTGGTATRIMTGAPIPDGADAVVMLERTQLVTSPDGPPRVRVDQADVAKGLNIMRRATSLARGQVVLSAGTLIRPVEIGLLCEVGRAEVLAVPRPRAAVLATGNELVAPDQMPAAGQIRNSNGPMLTAMVAHYGGLAVDLGVARDDADMLRERIARGLEHDVLLLSGGVSAGVLDLVPRVLGQLGVAEVFHKVRLKPGKPVWFGVAQGRESGPSLVFGLPGNPVSSLVCCRLFVCPALQALAGRPAEANTFFAAQLAAPHHQRADRPTFWPAKLIREDDRPVVQPLDWQGSADLCTLASADCLIRLPAGERQFEAGEKVDVLRL